MAEDFDERPHAPLEGELTTGEELRERMGSGLPALVTEESVLGGLTRAEIDMQISTAKKYPRSMTPVQRAIESLATLDSRSAGECCYRLPRKDKDGKKINIEGPSIRFAEIVLACWGNARVASRRTDLTKKDVEATGIFHDLETNVAWAKSVRRGITTSGGKMFSNDMINVTSNAIASIALRNAILAGVPKAIWIKGYEKAYEVTKGTVATLGARRLELIKAFAELNLTKEQVYALVDVRGADDIDLDIMFDLSGYLNAIRDGEATYESLYRDLHPAAPGADKLAAAFGPEPTPAHKLQPKAAQETVDPKTGEVTEPKPPKAEPAVEWPKPLLGYADPEEPYHLDGDGISDDGKRQTYKDGKPFSRATVKAGHKVYTLHPPVESATVEHAEAAAEADPAAAETSADGFDVSAFNAFADAVRLTETWLAAKAELSRFRRTAVYQGAPDDIQRRARLLVFNHSQALVEKGKDTVTPDTDPSYFALWLIEAPKHERRPMFSKLLRSPAYQALSDENKDTIASEVAGSEGDV